MKRLVGALFISLALVSCAGQPAPTVPAAQVADAVLVGAGDIASCDSNGDEATAALLDSIPGTVFAAGDIVYETGSESEFANCYVPSWGRHRARTRPAVGNHEYESADAAAYFSYFGAAAGEPDRGYYSYDLGAWHIVVLNSNCARVGGCDAGSPQEQWLRADLAANRSDCTLAYWHHPRFSSGLHGSFDNVQGLWQALYEAGVEVALVGHDHNYERFAPLNAEGRLDTVRGIREFVVGMGGKNHRPVETLLPYSEIYNDDTYGVLKLTLHATSYDWEFVPEAGKSFTDTGSALCTPNAPRVADAATTSTPGPATGARFSDDFENGDLAKWSDSSGLIVQQQEVFEGTHAARGTAAGKPSYALRELPQGQRELYYALRFKLLSQGDDSVYLLRFRSATEDALLGVFVSSRGRLGFRNDVTSKSTTSSTVVRKDEWHAIQVRVRVDGAASQVEVWLDGEHVDSLSQTVALGTTELGMIQLGDKAENRAFDVVFDDIRVDAQPINP